MWISKILKSGSWGELKIYKYGEGLRRYKIKKIRERIVKRLRKMRVRIRVRKMENVKL